MNIKEYFKALRFSPAHHLGAGDIRITMGQQEEIEAELAAMTKERDELKKDLGFSMDEANGLQGKLHAEREKVALIAKERDVQCGLKHDCIRLLEAEREKVATLRDSLKAYRDAFRDGPENCGYTLYGEVDEKAKQALEATA